jgi:outer membrane protein assembly factor BamA
LNAFILLFNFEVNKLMSLYFCRMRLLLPIIFALCFLQASGRQLSAVDTTSVYVKQVVTTEGLATKQKVVRREISVSVNAIYRKDVLIFQCEESARRLRNLGPFGKVTFEIQHTSPDTVIVSFAMNEGGPFAGTVNAALADRNANVWIRDYNARLNRVNFSALGAHTNLFGLCKRLRITGTVGFNTAAAVDLFSPSVAKYLNFGYHVNASWGMYKEYYTQIKNGRQVFVRHSNAVVQQQFAATAEVFVRPQYSYLLIGGIDYSNIMVDDTLLQINDGLLGTQNTKLQYIEPHLAYRYSKVDVEAYPQVGQRLRIRAGSKLNDKRALQNYVQLYASKFWRFTPHWLLSTWASAKTSTNPTQAFLFQNAFGFRTDYVRGYEYSVVNGEHAALARFDLKYKLTRQIFGFKFWKNKYAYTWGVYPKVFADAGKAKAAPYQLQNNPLANKMLSTIGVGLDAIVEGSTTIRLEYAINHLNQKGLFLHLTLL